MQPIYPSRLSLCFLVSIALIATTVSAQQPKAVPPKAVSPAVTVVITPTTQGVMVGKTQQFSATVAGSTNLSVTWTVNQVPSGNANFGTISASGLFTAPAAVPAPNTVTVTATSVADPKQFASATITVQPTVNVSPTTQGVEIGKTQQFTATVTGNSNSTVTWSVNQIAGGNANLGVISASGLYTAPSAVPSPSAVTVTATSVADSTQSASARVTVQPAGARPQSMSISISPPAISPVNGKVPTSASVSVSVNGCNGDSAIDLTTGGYTLGMTGVGNTFSTPSLNKCFLTSTLAIGAGPGDFSVVLYDGKNALGETSLGVLDATAGPIPSGLTPQVDVMYQVLSQSVCNDVFGKRVARNFYCIELKIGNNTGHPLQVAGIGFSRHIDELPGNPSVIQANTSYASTRAVLLREEVLSPRNVFYHSVQAAGLIMSGLQPFFVASNASKHFAIATSIVSGPALAAIGIVGPDRVVGQLNNLDDESFRDNQIIPNNTHIRTMVFIEKRAVTEELQDASHEYLQGLRSEFANNANQAAHDSGQLKTGGVQPAADTQNSGVSPDLQQIEEKQIGVAQKQTQQTVMNSEQKDTSWLFGAFQKGGGHSPLLVKMALGNVVIVGDEIAYLQRVQVQGGSSQPGSPSGVAVTISPTAQNVVVGATQQFTATVTGGSNTAVTWSVNDTAGGNTTLGTVSTAGLYTAPANIPSSNPVTVKATSAADSTQFSSATVTVTANPITVVISPTFATVAKTKTQQFSATVTGSTNATVTWSVNTVTGGNSTVGTITTAGLYTAPSAVPNPSTVTVTATSVAASTQSASAVVTIH
jgi:hypothetical protein